MLGVEDDWAGYQLDVAALLVGRHVEAEITKGKSAGEVLKAMQGSRPQTANSKRQTAKAEDGRRYRGVSRMPGMKVKRMKLPESGTW